MTKNEIHNLISLDNISVHLQGKEILKNISWKINKGENWVIMGSNGSGKSTLVRTIAGIIGISSGKREAYFNKKIKLYHENKKYIGYVSPELNEKIFKIEKQKKEFREYAGKDNEITNAKNIILDEIEDLKNLDTFKKVNKKTKELFDQITKNLNIQKILDKNIDILSTGEMRKILIARAMMKNPKILILDEPFDGLDQRYKEKIKKDINSLIQNTTLQIILVSHRIEEIPPNISHALLLSNGKISAQGKKNKIINNELLKTYKPNFKNTAKSKNLFSFYNTQKQTNIPKEFIKLKNVNITYDNKKILKNINLTIKKDENWAILGPNGSGKSTILKIIMADHEQAYSNDVWIFGHKRGSGESIWDIKKHIGFVSQDLQIKYTKKISGFKVICSGFFDSIGLYHRITSQQKKLVEKLILAFDIKRIVEKNFNQLSNGQKRIILIARALIKCPFLLILDEPTHGLDIKNRQNVLNIIERIGSKTTTNVLYVRITSVVYTFYNL